MALSPALPPRPRHVAVVLLVVVGATLAIACDDTTGSKSSPKVANPPDRSIVQAMSSRGVRAGSLDSTDSAAMIEVILSSSGLVASERQCASAPLLRLMEPAPSGEVRLIWFARLVQRLAPGRENTEMATTVAGCTGAESAARLASKTAAPDRDLSDVPELGATVSRTEARAVGLTDAEAACYADHLLAGIGAEEVAGLLSGTAKQTSANPLLAVDDCMTASRQAEVAVRVRKESEAYQQCMKDVSDELSRQITADATSSTVPRPDATTTTLRQYI